LQVFRDVGHNLMTYGNIFRFLCASTQVAPGSAACPLPDFSSSAGQGL
jgi:hypothetical protein